MYVCLTLNFMILLMFLLLQISYVTSAFVQSQEMAMSDAQYEVVSVLHLMAMVCLLQANTLLLPRSYGDGYAPRVSEGTASAKVLTVNPKVVLLSRVSEGFALLISKIFGYTIAITNNVNCRYWALQLQFLAYVILDLSII